MRIEALCVGTSAGCTIAAIKKCIRNNVIKKDDYVVCTLADNGLKYSDSLLNLNYLKKHNLNYHYLEQSSDNFINIKDYLKSLNIDFEVK